jgi:DNA-binding PadR family transcriptional regulator
VKRLSDFAQRIVNELSAHSEGLTGEKLREAMEASFKDSPGTFYYWGVGTGSIDTSLFHLQRKGLVLGTPPEGRPKANKPDWTYTLTEEGRKRVKEVSNAPTPL